MSTIERTQPERYQCARDGCLERATEYGMVAGSYCSQECHARATGSDFLEVVRRDHRFCWSCLRRRKEIERPTDEFLRGRDRHAAEAIVGYEYATEHVDEGDWGLECRCGAVDHDVPEYDRRDGVPWYWLLFLIGERLVEDGHRESGMHLPTLLELHYQTDDLELAVGAALIKADA